MRRATVAGCAMALTLATGCGNAATATDQIRNVIGAYNAALAAGDYTRACGLLSSGAKANIIATHGAAGTCPATLRKAVGRFSKIQRAAVVGALGHGHLKAISVKGSNATVTVAFTLDGRPLVAHYTAVKQGGAWKLAQRP